MPTVGFRDRFFTPTTAKAILSGRIAIGIGVGVALGVAGLAWPVAVAGGLGTYAAFVLAAMPKGRQRASVDPFVLSEPWRQIVQQAQRSGRRMRETLADADDGPLTATLTDIAHRLERGLDEAWEVAKRGDEIDDAVRRLDPTALRSRLETLREQAVASPSPEADAAVASVERQLDTAERLKQQSAGTAAELRLTQVRLDELVARASEVRLGEIDTADYRREVDDLVVRLEALHQAVEETRTT